MKQVSTGRSRLRYRPRHTPPTGLTVRRSAAGLAILSGVALFAGVAGNNGPASGGPARAAVPHAPVTVDVPTLPESTSSTTSAAAVQPTEPASSTSASAQHDGAVSPASGLAADGIPSTALAAYRQAAQREAGRNPSCGLPWPLLAGIGRVESDHGRFAGAVLHSDGLSTPPVIGIPLDGNGTAVIEDTDGGALDGDTVYDRAVGPMQFIPSTWAGWGVDANGDGSSDPFNIFDAAEAAADYLCAAGRDLTTTRGQVAAILSYNWSYDYVRMVMALERVYAGGVGITVPVLPTSANPHPGAGHGFPVLPPVDPGSPRGAGSTDTHTSGTGGPRSAGSGSGGPKPGGAGSSSGSSTTVRPAPSSTSAASSSSSSSTHPTESSTSAGTTTSSSSSSATDPGTSTSAEASTSASSAATTDSQTNTSTPAPASSGP